MNPKRLLLVLLVLAVLLPLAALAEAPAYEVTLPDGYDGTTQHYPTLYILPEDGFTPDSSGLAEQLSAAIARGEGTEMILVRPALAEGDPAAQVADVVAVVDAAYRTIPDPAYRAAVGTGTGGYLAYALTLAENSPFQAAASIRGDFASEDNPWLSVCGDIQAKLEALHSADADALNAFYTYLDAPVEDAWTDMKGSTDDLGSLFITYGTGSAFHEFTVRPGAFDEAFLAESASRVLSRLTGRLLSGIVSGQLTMEKTTLG